MGYNSTATTITLIAKLTPLGRQKLVSTNNALIKTFCLGDSDANYYSPVSLDTGQVPASSGNIGPNNGVSNSTTQMVNFKSLLILDPSGTLTKPISSQSVNILSEVLSNGFSGFSGSNITKDVIVRSSITDSLVNLYFSFGLPLNSNDDLDFTGTTFVNGGFSDTALSSMSATKILVLGVDNSIYGECMDGKTIKVVLPTSAGTYTIYSTYQGGAVTSDSLDANFSDITDITKIFGANVAALVSDDILTPNGGDITKSWGTGYNTNKPFTVHGKQTYNLQTNSNLGVTADTIVGMAYLDKGFIVITNPTIVNNYTTSLAPIIEVYFDSVSTNVYQNITCIADRGEFGSSTNPSFSSSDVPRISEVGLFDDLGNIIAIAKTDRHIPKNVNEFLALGIKISL